MRNKSLLILSFITLIIIVAAVISSRGRTPQTVIETAMLFPDLKGRINDVAEIAVETPAGAIHVRKQGEVWAITESDNYPARFDKIKETALTLAEMRILSAKTSNASLFAEIGVEDITAENAKSKLVTLKDSGGNALASLVVGHPRVGRTPEDSGVYVRKAGTNESWLVDKTIALSAEAVDWIEQDLLDIADSRILDTRIEHPDGMVLTINRPKGEEHFSVLDIPKDKQPRSSYFIDQVGTILSKLTIENVKARSGFTFPDTAVKTTIRTYDGLVAHVTTANVEGLNHITLEFSVDESLLPASTSDTAAPAETKPIVVGEQPKEETKTAEDIRKEVADLNTKVANWVYIINSSKYGLLVKQPTDVLQDKTEEKPAAEAPKPAG